MPIRPENRKRYRKMPRQADLLLMFRYEPETGEIAYRIGRRAFTTKTSAGYMQQRIDGHLFYAHRIAWKMHHGYDPKSLDHIDGNRANNAIANLREVSDRQNAMNVCRRSNNKSGACGVNWSKNAGKWRAFITQKGKQTHLGYFEKKSDAVVARLEAQKDAGFSDRHGQPMQFEMESKL